MAKKNLSKLNENRQISDREFLKALWQCRGIQSKTAEYIKEKHKLKSYSRSAVSQRVKNFPDEMAEIENANLDFAENNVYDLMNSFDEKVKADSTWKYLKTKGKIRGYAETQKVELEVKTDHESETFKEFIQRQKDLNAK